MSAGPADRSAPRSSARIVGLDAARGLALLGMFVAHTVVGGDEKLADGRSSILFATVAGVSLGLLSGGADPPEQNRGDRRIAILVRGLLLVVIGLVLSLLEPPLAVILDYYGFAFVLLVPALFLPRRLLLALAALTAVAAPPLVAALAEATPLTALPLSLQPPAVWLVYGNYPMLIWFAFFLVGLAAARWDLRQTRTQLALLLGGLAASATGYGAAWLVPGVSAEAHSGSTAEVLGSGGLACAVIGALTLLGRTPGLAGLTVRGLLGPLAAAGAMAFSLYVAHVVLLAAIDDPAAPGDYPPWVLPGLIVGALVIGTVWQRFLGSGPLEAGFRAATRAVVRRPESRVAQ